MLKDIINQKGINIHKLSEIAEIPYNTLYSIIKRNSKNISYNVIIRLSNALEMSPQDLYAAITTGGETS